MESSPEMGSTKCLYFAMLLLPGFLFQMSYDWDENTVCDWDENTVYDWDENDCF